MGAGGARAPAIVLVEDDASLSRAFGRVLATVDHEVVVVESAEKALEHLNSGAPTCVLIAELRLPGASGEELLVQLAETMGPAAPRALLLSGVPRQPPTGAAQLLVKPFRNEELRRAVRRLCRCQHSPAA